MVVGLQAKADRIQYGDEVQVDNWARIDVAPYVSRPFALSFLEFTPSAGYRYTRYGASYGTSLDENGDEVTTITGPPINRSFFEGQRRDARADLRARSGTRRASRTRSASST